MNRRDFFGRVARGAVMLPVAAISGGVAVQAAVPAEEEPSGELPGGYKVTSDKEGTMQIKSPSGETMMEMVERPEQDLHLTKTKSPEGVVIRRKGTLVS